MIAYHFVIKQRPTTLRHGIREYLPGTVVVSACMRFPIITTLSLSEAKCLTTCHVSVFVLEQNTTWVGARQDGEVEHTGQPAVRHLLWLLPPLPLDVPHLVVRDHCAGFVVRGSASRTGDVGMEPLLSSRVMLVTSKLVL